MTRRDCHDCRAAARLASAARGANQNEGRGEGEALRVCGNAQTGETLLCSSELLGGEGRGGEGGHGKGVQSLVMHHPPAAAPPTQRCQHQHHFLSQGVAIM